MQQVKIHGAFRTGTNYAKAMLELNYDVQVVATHGGWKHVPVPALFNRAHGWPIVGVVKDPYAWLASMWDYVEGPGGTHITCGPTWREFLTNPIVITHGLDDTVPDYRFATPVDYWNAMTANLLSLGPRCHVARYEDLLREPELTCQRVADQFALDRCTDAFVMVGKRTRNMVDRHRTLLGEYVTDEPFDPTALLERRYLDHFSRRNRRTVGELLDDDLVKQLAY